MLTKTQKQTEVRDTVVPFLIIVGYAQTDKQAYYVRPKWLNRKRIKLGTSDSMTVGQARLAAADASDPIRAKRRMTVDMLFEEYARNGRLSGKKSVELEASRYAIVIQPVIGAKSVVDIDLNDIHAVLETLCPSLSDGTRNRYLAQLRGIFRFAVQQSYCGVDPTRSLRLRKETPIKLYEVNTIFVERLWTAISFLKKNHVKAGFLVELLLLTGIRVGEALELQWSDVNRVAKHISLRKTKSGNARFVPLSPECLNLLDDLAEAAFSHACEGWLFPSERVASHMSRPVRPWKQACKEVGLPLTLRFHDLRHTFAAVCVQAAIPLYTVQSLLGHSSIRMTERYASLGREHLLAASDKASQALKVCMGGAK